MSTVDEPSRHGTAHTGPGRDPTLGSHDPRAGSAGAGHQCPMPGPWRGPDAQTVVVIQVCLDAAKEVLSSDDRTTRMLRLLRPMLWASVVTILGATVIAVSTVITLGAMGFRAWWESLAALGIAAIGSLGAAVLHARRRQAQRLPAVVDPSDTNS